jgi:predicted dehydrogenase
MRKLLKVGVLGLGKMGQLHLSNLVQMEGIKVLAVADKKKRNLKIAEKYHIKPYNDYTKLLEQEDLDAVIISLPNFLRKESITLASEKQVNIFVDKPLAQNYQEAKQIIQRVESNGTRLMVGTNYRYIESVQKLKVLLEEGRLGDIIIADGALIMNGPFSHPLVPTPVPEWWFDKEKAGGGVLLDLGYHLIDIFQSMFGELELLHSNLQHRFNLPIEDSATVILNAHRGAVRIVMNLGWFSRMIFPDFNFRINLHGTFGYSSTDHFGPRNLYIHAIKEGVSNFLRKILGREIHRLAYTYYYASFGEVLQLFFRALREGTPFPISLQDQLGVLKIIEDVYIQSGDM